MARIVVISDDSRLVTPLGDLLMERGGDTVTCCDDKGAFTTLQQGPTDLIILDLLVSKPEGSWDVLTFLQLHPVLRQTPVIVCSGPTDEVVAKEEWLEDHRVVVFFKPFDVDDLYRHVDTLLKRHGQS
jgi:DNA-binding response OmpR family regulator